MELQHEPRNQHDKNAVAVMKNGEIFGHIPRALASTKQGTGTVTFLRSQNAPEM